MIAAKVYVDEAVQAEFRARARIAAFARFTLELLALGAPAELVEASQTALADETRHARLCFGLATAYSGRPVGPTALEVRGALTETTLAGVLETTLREGCIGETQAALEARFALEHVTNPAVADVLARIAEDEARHAELAWRFVAWALKQDPSLEKTVREVLAGHGRRLDEQAENRHADGRAAFDADNAEGREHGVLSARDCALCARQAFDRVIAPCAAELLEPRERPRMTPSARCGLVQVDVEKHGHTRGQRGIWR